MSFQTSNPALLSLRALLVIAVLICLCVSSNVGLQFFPLPVATTQVESNVQLDQVNRTSQPPQSDAQSFRVPMMAQLKKRADKQPPQSDQLIVLTSDRLGLPKDTRFAIGTSHTVCFVTSVTMAPRAGRAPPSLI